MKQLFKELTFPNGVKAKNKFLLAPLTNMQSPDQGKISDDEYDKIESLRRELNLPEAQVRAIVEIMYKDR